MISLVENSRPSLHGVCSHVLHPHGKKTVYNSPSCSRSSANNVLGAQKNTVSRMSSLFGSIVSAGPIWNPQVAFLGLPSEEI